MAAAHQLPQLDWLPVPWLQRRNAGNLGAGGGSHTVGGMSDLPIPRHLLEKYFGDDPRMVAAMEEQSQAVETSTAAVAATDALKDATVIVLSPNGDFTNERVLEWDEGIEVELTDSA